MIKKLTIMLLITTGIFFNACGGGGGGSDSNTSSNDSNASADAGLNQKVMTNSEVKLDASNSIGARTYSWMIESLPDGSEAILSDETSKHSVFSADLDGNYTISLTINAGSSDSSEDKIIVNADINYTESITHNGLKYGIVRSPFTEVKWLDRNLGASKACTALDDEACFGDYYQWGRDADGHQSIKSGTTPTQATSTTDAGKDFIKSSADYGKDWAKSADSSGAIRKVKWSIKDGTSICPKGFKVPARDELRDETIYAEESAKNNTEAFNNFLKIPSAGKRDFGSAQLRDEGKVGALWTTSITPASSNTISFNKRNGVSDNTNRAYGFPVRCVMSNSAPVANAGLNQDLNVTGVVTLDASSSEDIDGDSLEYSWKIVHKPTDSEAELSDSTVSNPTFEADKAGGYVLSLVVSDGKKNSIADEVAIKVGLEKIISHNGVDYESIISPHTGKIWLDRNLGASKACTALDDEACFGDYYQWGRDADGHQSVKSGTTATQATSTTDAGKDFITSVTDYGKDWAFAVDGNASQRKVKWTSADGLSVCPKGFRVPGRDELKRETTSTKLNSVQNNTDAFNNFLKIPSSGKRDFGSAELRDEGKTGALWTTSITKSGSSATISFNKRNANQDYTYRAYGFPVRCVMD